MFRSEVLGKEAVVAAASCRSIAMELSPGMGSPATTGTGEATDVSSSAMFGGRTVGVLREIFFFWRAVWLGLGGV
jgi:hypothetical protein